MWLKGFSSSGIQTQSFGPIYAAADNAVVDVDTTEILLKELNVNGSDLAEHLNALAGENKMPDGFLVSTAGLALQLRHLLKMNPNGDAALQDTKDIEVLPMEIIDETQHY